MINKKGLIIDIEKEALENNNFRKVIYTSNYSQLVVMSIQPGDDIGEEIHGLDQFIRVESGNGKAVLNNQEYEIKDDWAVIIPAGVKHNVINTSDTPLKLYSIYSPPEHKDGTVHNSKSEAEEEHFDGTTTE